VDRVLSPSQTIWPLYGFSLMFEGSQNAVPPHSPGAIAIEGRLSDGEGPLAYPDAMLEIWQGDLWARGRTDEDGVFRFVVRKPAATPLPDGRRRLRT
jgi:protocatechuate 3,4-dioxygenase alpha subunit